MSRNWKTGDDIIRIFAYCMLGDESSPEDIEVFWMGFGLTAGDSKYKMWYLVLTAVQLNENKKVTHCLYIFIFVFEVEKETNE
jgi:hypothetical protein